MTVPSIEDLEQRLKTATEKLRSARTGNDDPNEEIDALKVLLNEVKERSREDRSRLSTQVDTVATEVQFYAANEKATEVMSVIQTIRDGLAELSADVEAGKGEKKKNWFTGLFTGGIFSLEGMRTSMAFSFGEAIQEAKDSGFFKGMWLNIASWFVGKERVQLAASLKGAGFQGIDAKEGTLRAVMDAYTANYSAIPFNVFTARLAKKARQTVTGDTISYKQLEEVAATLGEIAGAATATVATATGVVEAQQQPEVTQGDVLQTPVMVAAGLSLFVRGDTFEFKSGNNLQKLRLYNQGGGDVEDVTSAIVKPDGSMDVSLSVPVDNVYNGTISKQDFMNIAAKIAANQTIDTKVTMKVASNGASYDFEFVKAS